MTDWASILHSIAPDARASVVEEIAPHLDEAIGHWPALVQAHFLGQAAEETAGFTALVEEGGAKYFRRYDRRKDLGNSRPGDGFKFRGRGPLMATGRDNYTRFGKEIGVDLVKNPDEAAKGVVGVPLCVRFWNEKGCTEAAEADNVVAVTRKINGGTNGLANRKAYLARAKHALGVVGGVDAVPPKGRAKVKAVQQRLSALGYHMVGRADGKIGANTTSAVAAFQHDKDLPVNGELDANTEAALWAVDDVRPIDSDRANGQPDDSPAFGHVQNLVLASGLTTGGLGVAQLNGALSQAEAVKGYADRVQALAEPLHPLGAVFFAHPGICALVASAGVLGLAFAARNTLVAAFRVGKLL